MAKRGRKALDRTDLHARVAPETLPAIREIARNLGYTYGDGAATGELLDDIASGSLVVLPKETWANLQKVVARLRDLM